VARSTRLLMLLQTLRGRSRPVTASALAAELGVSERTLYRDIAELSAQGAPIYGEAGIGYVLRPGLFLPPLMLTEDETEAIVLGLRYVDQRGDEVLAQAAAVALAKIGAVLAPAAKEALQNPIALPGPRGPGFPANAVDLRTFRAAIRSQRKLRIVHRCEGRPQQARRLADRPWLYERGPRAAGMVRATASLSDIPHRPDHGSGGNRGALQGASRTAYARLARADEPRRNGTLYS
jgi:predicted DNA-binding transcriptional regulator YafY